MNVKYIFLTMSAIIVLFISGCGGSTSSSPSNEEYHTGTQGIVMNFLVDAPPSKVYEGDNIDVMIEYYNKGATDVSGGSLYLSGFDKMYLPFSPTRQTISIDGKSIYNPTGDLPVITTPFSVSAARIPDGADELRQKVKITSCYKYTTTATAEICIAPMTREIRNDVCTPHDVAIGGGQGGPVAVTKVEQEIYENRVQFKIHLQNSGGGDLISNQKSITNCHTDLEYSDLNRVDVRRVSFSEKTLTCQPRNPVPLQNGQGYIYCYYQGDLGDDAYLTQLKIELDYGYRDSIEKDILILNLPGS